MAEQPTLELQQQHLNTQILNQHLQNLRLDSQLSLDNINLNENQFI